MDLIATEVDFPAGRPAGIAMYNIGAQKVLSLNDHGIDPSQSLFSTDGASELPLMDCVATCILVSPSRATRRAVVAYGLRTPTTTLRVRR